MIPARPPQIPLVTPGGFTEEEPSRPAPFRDIFESEYGYVRQVAKRLGIRERELDDIVHDVFLTVHRKMDEFDAGRPLRPWLFGITFRVVVGTKRRFAYSRERLAGDAWSDPADKAMGADEQLEAHERTRLVHEALLALDLDKRAVFILHELEELPMSEIATTLGLPTNTAYSRLRLAREEFRVALGRLLSRRSRAAHGGVS